MSNRRRLRKRRSPRSAPEHSRSHSRAQRPCCRWFCCHKTQIVTLAKQTLNGMHVVISGGKAAREHVLTVCDSGQAWSHSPVATTVVLGPLPAAALAWQPLSPISRSSWHEIKGHSAQLWVPCSPTGLHSGPPCLTTTGSHQFSLTGDLLTTTGLSRVKSTSPPVCGQGSQGQLLPGGRFCFVTRMSRVHFMGGCLVGAEGVWFALALRRG